MSKSFSGIQQKTILVRQLTEKEAAALTGYSHYWFQRKRWAGGGPPYRKIGRSVRYPSDLLMEWIESYGLHTSTIDDERQGAA